MKKLILLTAFAVTSGICLAQTSFGVQAGANIAMGKFKYDDAQFTGSDTHSQKNKANVGFLGGFIAEIPIGASLAFRPELNFIQEGTKLEVTVTSGLSAFASEDKAIFNYIQLPLNVIYKLPVGPGTAFFGLGPTLQFGISGKDKYSSATNPTDNKNYTVKFDGNKSDDVINDPNTNYYNYRHLKRFDVGADVLAGYQLGMGGFLKLAYSHGFLELDPNKKNANPADRSSYKNSGFNVSVGYMLSCSKKSGSSKKGK